MNNSRAYLLAAIFGAGLTLALAPFYWIVMLFVGFSGLLWLLDMVADKRSAFWLGYWFGFGHFVTGLYWISSSLLIDIGQHGWLIPFAVVGIPAILGVYSGLVVLATYVIGPRGIWRTVIFAGIWLVAELLRSHLFTGFPWNLTGYSLMVRDEMMQTAHLWGVYGLSLIAVWLGTVPYLWMNRVDYRRQATLFALVLCVVLFSYGNWRLAQGGLPDRVVNVRIVQANVAKKASTSYDDRIDQVWRHMKLTASPAGSRPELIVWPESAIALLLEDQPDLRRDIAKILPDDSVLLAGGIRVDIENERIERLWNSLFVLSDYGEIVDIYDKRHLVPFGEYVPLRSMLPFLDKVTEGTIDVTVGESAPVLTVAGIKITPLICYEAIFPDGIEPSQLLVNVTDDAWFGDTIGPHQHLAMSKMRAVEQGVPLLRAANTGISAAVDKYGRVIGELGVGEAGVLDVKVVISDELDAGLLYRNFGMLVPILMVLGLLGIYSFVRIFAAASRKD